MIPYIEKICSVDNSDCSFGIIESDNKHFIDIPFVVISFFRVKMFGKMLRPLAQTHNLSE